MPFKYECKPYVFAIGDAAREIVEKVEPKLVAWWMFDENSGETAADSSGNRRDGILVGNPSWRPSGGRFRGALEFDGSNHVEVPNLDMTSGAATFVAWINGWRRADMTGVVLARKGGFAAGIHFGPGDTLHYTWNRSSRRCYEWHGGPKIPQNEWAMLALTIEPTKATAYVYSRKNGLQQSVNAIPHMSQALDAVNIGWDAWSPNRRFKGLMDDVRIYNYALSRAEIEGLCSGRAPVISGNVASGAAAAAGGGQ